VLFILSLPVEELAGDEFEMFNEYPDINGHGCPQAQKR
jgi:hypothetical protein